MKMWESRLMILNSCSSFARTMCSSPSTTKSIDIQDGVAMGSPLGPLLADIFMGKLESTELKRFLDECIVSTSDTWMTFSAWLMKN